jgi:dTDP-4-dehydrorhamnose 3,5-epimerase
MINDVILTPLKVIETPGGRVMHALKDTDLGFDRFGEAYFSEVQPMKIKAWKRHRDMTLNLIVPFGKIRFVIFDDRMSGENSYQEFTLSIEEYYRLTIPPMVWLGFQGKAECNSMLLNIANLSHDPSEVDRKNIDEIEFNWGF